MLVVIKNLGPIGLAVLTFVGYKQTNKHPDKQSIYRSMYIVQFLKMTWLLKLLLRNLQKLPYVQHLKIYLHVI